MNLLKKILLPQSEQVFAHKSWAVRWESRHGLYSGDTKPEIEVFPLKEDAVAFKQALEDAFKLIRHTSGTKVTIQEQG